MKRDEGIDFWRGIACIAVIMIHTVFHSGNNYIPSNISCWFLLFDVPVFMYLAGMAYFYSNDLKRKIKEILNIVKKWIIFIICAYIVLWFIDRDAIYFKDIFSWIAFSPKTSSQYIYSLKSSLYFIPYYIEATLIGAIILYFIKGNKDKVKIIINIILLLLFILISTNNGISYFNLNSNVIAYIIFFLLGYISMFIKFKNLKIFLLTEFVLIIFVVWLFHINNIDISALQSLKLPNMNYIYFITSLISIIFVFYIKDKFRYKSKFAKPIKYIGKNSICMFFSQGISSSLLYMVNNLIGNSLSLNVKIIAMFTINLSMALIIFLILTILYNVLNKMISKLKEKIKITIFLSTKNN